MNKYFMGLDLSTSCTGLVILSLANGKDVSIEKKMEIKPKSTWATEDRCDYIGEQVYLESLDYSLEAIWAEAIGTRFIQTAMGMGRVHQSVAKHMSKSFINKKVMLKGVYKTISPSELKKFATGKGNAKKEDMIRAALDWFPGETFTDNEADALFVASYGVTQYWVGLNEN